MNRGPLTLLLCCLALTAGAAPAATTRASDVKLEPWADASLPVTQGLSLWLDAARQPAAWQAHGRPSLESQNALDVWYDASGHARHFTQPVRAAQPKFIAGEKAAALRFDGENDHLHHAGGRRELGDFTLVLAAAPKTNAGNFRGLFSGAEAGKNDYSTGLNLDLGPFGGEQLDVLNVEGGGFSAGGFRNLLKTPSAFRQLLVVTVTGETGAKGIQAYLNGKPEGTRERSPGRLRADHLYLAARYYSNDPAPPFVSGFLDGDVAEVLLYDRRLSAEELGKVHGYVSRKHERYAHEVARAGEEGELLRSVENPPDVQVFVPGFTARALPVELTNINNVRYREDGKLVALAYDGNVYVLSDTDGDGLEDKADLFWDNQGRLVSPIGMALTPPGYKAGRGLFVASKGKVSLIVDADGDGKAEKETIVAEGWKPLPHQVDALGVAVAPDGSVYFGLGTTNFTNAYLTDAAGKAKYDLKDERGAILKISPDFSKREIVCTGIRFPVGMVFNREGDLFATDQEGATWLANGNPFDELLHIQPGRHYGFPPRHPTHLPNVIDEPSVFDYTPQHQSTCGLFFNEPVSGGPVFGPAAWRGDVFVCGSARGKMYRTRLAKTAAGYVAWNGVLASLTMLTIDTCVSPDGALLIATHSGNPDWGSGPKGKGRLYKIRYGHKDEPLPTVAWAAGPHEVRVAFDRPLDPTPLRDAAKNASITYGGPVGAGDRFEKIRPGYVVVQRQSNEPRRKLPVTGVQITGDRRTLVLSTARQTHAASYALSFANWGRPQAAPGEIVQADAIDLAYDLSGVAAEWQPTDAAGRKWSGWTPHPDLAVSRSFTAGSADHDALFASLKTPGRLTLRTSLDLWDMFRPAVQPGSKIDYTLPAEKVTVTFQSNAPLEVRATGATPQPSSAGEGEYCVSVTIDPKEAEPLPVEIVLATGPKEPTLTVTFTTQESGTARPLPLRRFLLPWARPKRETGTEVARAETPQLKGGNWLRGRDVFFSDAAACAKCHRVHGQGSDLGPDLSNLIHRDYDSVLRDIRDPSGALNPDFIASKVSLKDGREFHGILRSVGTDRFVVRADAEGEKEPIARDQIQKVTASSMSVMPEGLEAGLGPEKVRDLLTFLLTEPLEPAAIERPGHPPPRTRAEVEKVIAAAGSASTTQPAAPTLKKLKVMLVSGPKDHGPSEHDYPAWQKRWTTLLGLATDVTVSQANVWPTPEQWSTADVAVFYSANPAWTEEKAKDLDAFLSRGGGLVFIHFAINGQNAVNALADRTGLAWRNGGSAFRHGPVELTMRDADHPITRGFEKVRFIDESYWNLVGDPKRIRLLADAVENREPQPLLWTLEKGRGRVFVSVLGHYSWTFDDPLFRLLLLRGICWTAGEPADRFNTLVNIGARVQD